MRLHSVLLISLLACAVFCSSCSSEPDYAGYENRWSASSADPDKLRELRDDITRELSQKPDDERLLRLRVGVNTSLEDFAAAGKDIYKLAELFPIVPYYQFEKCLTMERHNGYNAATTQCYAVILPLYENKLSTEELERNPTYITIALLAESPGAEKLREDYIRKAGDESSSWFDKQLLQHFDRKIFVEGKIPPEALPKNAPRPLRSR